MAQIIAVKVIPNSKSNEIVEGNPLKVRLTKRPVGGKANNALIDMLSEYYKTKKKNIRIIRGEKSRNKVVEIA